MIDQFDAFAVELSLPSDLVEHIRENAKKQNISVNEWMVQAGIEYLDFGDTIRTFIRKHSSGFEFTEVEERELRKRLEEAWRTEVSRAKFIEGSQTNAVLRMYMSGETNSSPQDPEQARRNAYNLAFAYHWPIVLHEWELKHAARLGAERTLVGKTDAIAKNPEAAPRLQGHVAGELNRLDFIKTTGWPWPASPEETEVDGMAAPMAHLIAHLRARFCPQDTGSALQVLEAAATQARVLLTNWKTNKEVAESPWARLTPTRAARLIAEVVWIARLREELEREGERGLGIIRVGTDLSKTFALARVHGGQIVAAAGQQSILVEPPRGTALMLPFDDGLRVTKGGGGLVGLRQILTPRALRTHFAALFLYQDQGMREDGSFCVSGPTDVLEVTGATRHEEKKGNKTYSRYATKDMRGVVQDFELFSTIRVRGVGDVEAAAGDPLIDRIKNRRDGQTFYAHSRLVVGQLRTNYFRVPRAAWRLTTSDFFLAVGIAQIARECMVRHMKDGDPIEAPIREWLEAAGVNVTDHARKQGREFWPTSADDLARVATAGGLGRMACSGKGREMVLTFTPDESLRTSYGPLLEGAKAHAKAKRAAMVADKRKPRSRRAL